ncbi:MAG: hypothetical protein QM793_03365 [Muricomes sp.]
MINEQIMNSEVPIEMKLSGTVRVFDGRESKTCVYLEARNGGILDWSGDMRYKADLSLDKYKKNLRPLHLEYTADCDILSAGFLKWVCPLCF